jgi:two-component system sensor histidine kinase QseC
MPTSSLRLRLIALVLIGMAIIWVVALAASYRYSLEEVDELFDARLAEAARALLILDLKDLKELGGSPLSGGSEDDHDKDEERQARVAFQLWSADGKQLLHTTDAPPLDFIAGAGFRMVRADGESWHSFAEWDRRGDLQVRVFEREAGRHDLARGIVLRMVRPVLLALPVLGVMVWLAVGRGLRPIRSVSAAITVRSAANLEAIKLQRVPVELTPMLDELNRLLARLDASLRNERRFTADAAHELRTPLAAIKVQAEVALASEEEGQRRAALDRIVEGVNRTARLAQQLLTLARLEHDTAPETHPVALDVLLADAVARHIADALGKDIDVRVEAEANCFVQGDAAMLEALIGNLLDNAVRYTPERGKVIASVTDNGSSIRLAVRDNGPGIPDEAKEHLFDRFYRVARDQPAGSGLGLSIVERIALLHGATKALVPGIAGHGFGIEVRFPKAVARG